MERLVKISFESDLKQQHRRTTGWAIEVFKIETVIFIILISILRALLTMLNISQITPYFYEKIPRQTKQLVMNSSQKTYNIHGQTRPCDLLQNFWLDPHFFAYSFSDGLFRTKFNFWMKNSSGKVELLGQDSFQNVRSFSISYVTLEGTAKRRHQTAKKNLGSRFKPHFLRDFKKSYITSFRTKFVGLKLGSANGKTWQCRIWLYSLKILDF